MSRGQVPWGRLGLLLPCGSSLPRGQRLIQKLPLQKLPSRAPALWGVRGPGAQLPAESRAPPWSCRAWQRRIPRSSRTEAARPIRVRFCTV